MQKALAAATAKGEAFTRAYKERVLTREADEAVGRAKGELSLAEREDIALLRAQGHGVREIARRTGRHASMRRSITNSELSSAEWPT